MHVVEDVHCLCVIFVKSIYVLALGNTEYFIGDLSDVPIRYQHLVLVQYLPRI